MLLGDPALLLPIPPSDISLKVAGPVSPGIRITIKRALPERLAGATVRLTLERSIASRPTELEALPDGPVKTRNKIMIEIIGAQCRCPRHPGGRVERRQLRVSNGPARKSPLGEYDPPCIVCHGNRIGPRHRNNEKRGQNYLLDQQDSWDGNK